MIAFSFSRLLLTKPQFHHFSLATNSLFWCTRLLCLHTQFAKTMNVVVDGQCPLIGRYIIAQLAKTRNVVI